MVGGGYGVGRISLFPRGLNRAIRRRARRRRARLIRFGFEVIEQCPNVPAQVLVHRALWSRLRGLR